MTEAPSARVQVSMLVLLVAALWSASCTAPPPAPAIPVTLRWYCWNTIFTPTGDGDRWWGGPLPALPGPLEEHPAPNDGHHEHVATGVLAVRGPDDALFTASTGVELALTRLPAHAVIPAVCRLLPG